MVALDSGALVTVFGGSGFVGRHIVRKLARNGYRIRVAVRRPDLAGHLQPLGGVGQIHAVQANLRDEDSVRRVTSGSDAVINLVGILYNSGKQTFISVHVDGARYAARAARDFGAQSFIQLSSIGADVRSLSNYAWTKANGEAAVLSEFPEATILRSSIIFGPEDEFFNRFASLARFSPVLPLIGGGHTKFQPVYVGDVAEAVAACLEGKSEPGKTYEIGGPEILTFKKIMRKILQYTDRRRILLPVPFWFAKLQAFFLQMLPSPLLTVDQVRILRSDNIVSEEAIANNLTLEGLGISNPQLVDAIVPTYLERFRSKGQFQHAGEI